MSFIFLHSRYFDKNCVTNSFIKHKPNNKNERILKSEGLVANNAVTVKFFKCKYIEQQSKFRLTGKAVLTNINEINDLRSTQVFLKRNHFIDTNARLKRLSDTLIQAL